MRYGKYNWLHIPSGEHGVSEFSKEDNARTADQERVLMDRWNAQDPGVWQYWLT